ncbi:hypothetical protein BC827DRAFT_1135427, partial [Russula dissimulans]
EAQGQSVKTVGINLQHPIFSHGQLYVALSRATSYRRIKVLPERRYVGQHYCQRRVQGRPSSLTALLSL